MKRVLSAIVAAVALAGCVSITPRAERIMVQPANSQALSGCKKVGPVTAKASAWNQMTYDDVNRQAENNMRDAAAAQYGDAVDTVVLIHTDTGMSSSTAQGIAYKCF